MRDTSILEDLLIASYERGLGPHGDNIKHIVELPMTDEEYNMFVVIIRTIAGWKEQAKAKAKVKAKGMRYV